MRSTLELGYNTDMEKIAIPEYGRNIHKMVQHAIKLQDKQERNKCVNVIIKVMDLINPSFKDQQPDRFFTAHLHIISNFELDVESPYKKPEKELYQSRPDEVPYPSNAIKFKHYGKIMEDMVKAATELKEGDDKTKLVKHIANLLKTSYLQWNRDSVHDSLIIKQLEDLSGGKLTISAEQLRDTNDIVKSFKKKKTTNKNYSKNKPRRKYNGSF